MTYNQLKNRKAQLFEVIMKSKYANIQVSAKVVKEYRFLQREEKRMIKEYKMTA